MKTKIKKRRVKTDLAYVTEKRVSRPKTGSNNVTDQAVSSTCEKIQGLKRIRDQVLKSRIMVENRLASCTAQIVGYRSGMTDEERKEHWNKAKIVVETILKSKQENYSDDFITTEQYRTVFAMVLAASGSIIAFTKEEKKWCKKMEEAVKNLPIYAWVEQIRGVGALTLANIIGETGDLDNYDNPAKVWKRMGCAPFESNGETHTGKAWKIGKWHENKLTKSDWVDFGYCPRRRSVMYNLSKGIVMQCSGKNAEKEGADNVYMLRYLEAKEVAKEKHPDWSDGHLNSHGLLLAGKRFLREMWIEWTQ